MTFAEKLTFIATHQRQEEASLLAQALDRGVDALYHEALIDAYLNGSLSRAATLNNVSTATVTFTALGSRIRLILTLSFHSPESIM